MNDRIFKLSEKYRAKEGLTISTNLGLGEIRRVTYFRLGKNTNISEESYSNCVLYIADKGRAGYRIGGNKDLDLSKGDIMFLKPDTLAGVSVKDDADGFCYIEILLEEKNMNNLLKAGEVFKLKDLIEYEENSISNLDIVKEDKIKFMVLAFDDGTELQEHRAPGDAIVFALEGSALISYDGKDYIIKEGENFRFEKNALHNVKAKGRFKMALLLVV